MKTLNLTTLEAADLIDAIDDRVAILQRSDAGLPMFIFEELDRYRDLRERLEKLSGD